MTALATLQSVWRARAEATCLIDAPGGRAWTYAGLAGQVLALADHLAGHGLRRGDRLAVLLENSAEFAALYLACLHLGVVAMPVGPGLSARDRQALLQTTGARAIACSSRTARLLPAAELRPAAQVVWISDGDGEGWRLDVRGAPSNEEPFLSVDPAADASIHFTSGTTSLPKGVVHRAGSLLDAAAAFVHGLGIEPTCRFLHVLPMSYMAGYLNLLLCPLLAGGSIVLDDAWDARRSLTFWQTPMRHQVTALWLVPSMLASLLRVDRSAAAPGYCRESVRRVLVGTAPLPEAVRAAFAARYGVSPLESYGLSETLFLAAVRPDASSVVGSVGPPLDGVQLAIRDDGGRDASAGLEGEVWARTPWNLAAYLDTEGGVETRLPADAWFPTGDLGRLDAAGRLFITGRKKDLIIRGGVNVSPRAVEEALLRREEVADVAVVGVPHPVLGEEVVAVVSLRPGLALTDVEETLRSWCQAELAPVAAPSAFLSTDALARNSNGKVLKAQLRAWAAERLGRA